MCPAPAPSPTTDRLLAAATELFAARGYHATSIRDIAQRAGANVAAGHYHYGSKDALYLQVFREQFAQVGAVFAQRGIQPSRARLRTMQRAEVEQLLAARVASMLEFLVGPPPSPHGALMMRELADPTSALPIIVAEFIRPQVREMGDLVARLAPRLGPETTLRVVLSIISQILMYRFNMPSLLLLLDRPSYGTAFIRRTAEHIVRFSLGGLDATVRAARRGARPRGRRAR